MKEIGVVASNSRSCDAPILVYKAAENDVREEALVVVEDAKFKTRYLGVLRWVTKYDPLLSTGQRSAVVEKPEIAEGGVEIPYETSSVRIIGVISNGRLEPAATPPTPRSKVYLVESSHDLSLDMGSGLVVGAHKYSNVELPLRIDALKYHVAVVGTTGTGKSRLVKALLDEVLAKTDYNIVIFDHTGTDYTPYWPEKTVKADQIVLDLDTITEGLESAVGVADDLISAYMPVALVEYAVCEAGFNELCNKLKNRAPDPRVLSSITRESLEEMFLTISRKGAWDTEKLANTVSHVASSLSAKSGTPQKLALYLTLFAQHYVRRLNEMRYKVDELVKKVREEKMLVVDLSTIDTEARRVIVKRFLERFWEIITEDSKPVNTLIVIDEAHNYACYQACTPSNRVIEKTLREGRKWGLGVVLVSQRVLDFSPDVRNNVNTVFFSKLQTPYDFEQLKNFVDLAGVRSETLSMLETREFFFAGLGNPLKYPMLIKVREVGRAPGVATG